MNRLQQRTKIEKLGLAEECIKLKGQGLGSVRIGRALTVIVGEEVSSVNVDNFYKSLKVSTKHNKVLAQKLDSAVANSNLVVLGQWTKLDKEFEELLRDAKAIQTKIISSKGGDKEIRFRDLRLLKDVIMDIAKMTEIRARLLGQMQSGIHIHTTNIENQYVDLKQLIIQAEDKFPGIGEWVGEKMVTVKQAPTS